MRSFTVDRQRDETGVSGTGVVLEGVVFSTGITVVHWLRPEPRGSVGVFDSFDMFLEIHVTPHSFNQTLVRWSDGETWDYALDAPHRVERAVV